MKPGKHVGSREGVTVFKKTLLLTWGFAFILAEISGMALAYLAYSSGISKIYHNVIADVTIIAARFSLLAYIATRMSRVGLADAIYKPLPNRKATALLPVIAACTIIIDYFVTVTAYGSYTLQLAGYNYFVKKVCYGLSHLRSPTTSLNSSDELHVHLSYASNMSISTDTNEIFYINLLRDLT